MGKCNRCGGQSLPDGRDMAEMVCVQCGDRKFYTAPEPVVDARLTQWTVSDAVEAGRRGAAARWRKTV